MLARMAASLQPDLTPAKDQTIDTLKELLTARCALAKDRTATLNRSKGLTLALLKRQPDQHLKQITARITAIDAECHKLMAAAPHLKARRAARPLLPPAPGTTLEHIAFNRFHILQL